MGKRWGRRCSDEGFEDEAEVEVVVLFEGDEEGETTPFSSSSSSSAAAVGEASAELSVEEVIGGGAVGFAFTGLSM